MVRWRDSEMARWEEREILRKNLDVQIIYGSTFKFINP